MIIFWAEQSEETLTAVGRALQQLAAWRKQTFTLHAKKKINKILFVNRQQENCKHDNGFFLYILIIHIDATL